MFVVQRQPRRASCWCFVIILLCLDPVVSFSLQGRKVRIETTKAFVKKTTSSTNPTSDLSSHSAHTSRALAAKKPSGRKQPSEQLSPKKQQHSPKHLVAQKDSSAAPVLDAPQIGSSKTIIKNNNNNAVISSRRDRHPSSTGEAIQLATTVADLMEICSQLSSADHQNQTSDRRLRQQRWSAQLLQKLGNLWPSNINDNTVMPMNIWQDERLAWAVVVAANVNVDDNSKYDDWDATMPNTTTIHSVGSVVQQAVDLSDQGRSVQWALQGLAALAGKTPATTSLGLDVRIQQGIRCLIQQAEYLAGCHGCCQLQQVIEMRWASRGLLMRLKDPYIIFPTLCDSMTSTVTDEQLNNLLPNMQERVQNLPFDIIPCGIKEWSSLTPLSNDHDRIMKDLLQDIPFAFDQILTRQGALITERRGTAWVTEPGIGPMVYSGKLMPSHSPLPPRLQSIMRRVESIVGMELGFLDCALCNWYPHNQAAMKYHSDPDHGNLWDRRAVVVAIGDPRRFAFRPNPNNDTANWQAWDSSSIIASSPSLTSDHHKQPNQNDQTPAIIHLFSGDIVKMWGTCNDDFQHAVLQGTGPSTDDESHDGHGRISLVMKHALLREYSS